jgi:hypothetical protein
LRRRFDRTTVAASSFGVARGIVSFVRIAGVLAGSAAVSLAGCNAREAAAPLPSQPSPKLRQIFVNEMLGARVPYLESLIGPAMTDDGGVRSYKVDGCEVSVGARGEDIQWLRLTLTPTCTFDTKSLLWNFTLPPPDRLTFGAFDKAARVFTDYQADCLVRCGRSDQGVYETWEGPMADAQMEVLLEADQSDPATKAAVDNWAAALEKAHGSAWIDAGAFNCDGKASDLGRTYLAKAKLYAITLGHGIATPSDSCAAVAVDGSSAGSATQTAPADGVTTARGQDALAVISRHRDSQWFSVRWPRTVCGPADNPAVEIKQLRDEGQDRFLMATAMPDGGVRVSYSRPGGGGAGDVTYYLSEDACNAALGARDADLGS